MFTGLVEEIGIVESVQKAGEGANFSITGATVSSDLAIGDSIAVNGACLTVVSLQTDCFTVQAVGETLQRTTLSRVNATDRVNLERPLKPASRLGGHFVQGHVDTMATIEKIETKDPGFWVYIMLEKQWAPFCVEKGSIAIDGVSLTIAHLLDQEIAVAVIPHTARSTILGEKRERELVNIEVDILGKYVYRFTQKDQPSSLSLDDLQEWGY